MFGLTHLGSRFGIRHIITKRKDSYADRVAAEFAMFITMGTLPKVCMLYMYKV